MKLTVLDGRREDAVPLVFDVSGDDRFDELCALVEAEVGIVSDKQSFTARGRTLTAAAHAADTLASLGLEDGDMLLVRETRPAGVAGGGAAERAAPGDVRRRSSTVASDGSGRMALPASKRTNTSHIDPSTYPALAWEDIPGDISPDTLHAILQVNERMMALIRRSDPDMASAAEAPTPAPLRSLLMRRHMERAVPQLAERNRMAQLEARVAANPMDVEAQREIEDMIAQQNVRANLELALEHMPEAFARVFMLYVPALINGTPVKVFVDSGAQTTIISRACAARCGIMRLVDPGFAGQAVGVGTAAIVGRVHMAPLVLAGKHFNCTFTVLDNDAVDCLLGLDMLRRYQSCIDLHTNVLRMRLGDEVVEVPFLGEADIPRSGLDAEPASAGAGSVGAQPTPPVPHHVSGNDVDARTPAAVSGGGSGGSGGSSGSGGSGGSGAPSSLPDSTRPFAPASVPVSSSAPPSTLATSPASVGGGTGGSGAPPAAPSPVTGTASLFAPINLSGLGVATTRTRPTTASSAAPPATAATTTHGMGAPVAAGVHAPSGVSEADVQLLVGMGFPRHKCVQALIACNGSVEAAAELLPSL